MGVFEWGFQCNCELKMGDEGVSVHGNPYRIQLDLVQSSNSILGTWCPNRLIPNRLLQQKSSSYRKKYKGPLLQGPKGVGTYKHLVFILYVTVENPGV